MFSQTAEYALRAAVFLAENQPTRFSVIRIAEATRAPAGYLAKVLQSLARAGVVIGQRGLRGGFTLTRDPGAISVLEIVNAVDPVPRIERCPLDNPDHVDHLCPLHRRLDEALAVIENGFRESKLSDLVGGGSFSSFPVGKDET